MPVGTYGTVKAMTPLHIEDTGAGIVLGNTFHLMLRPGVDVVKQHGGLHKFMNWSGAILTDSGGFQVFSLGKMRKISEEGVKFQSPINGDKIMLTPERSIEVQRGLGSDIIMVFDECTPYPATHSQAKESMELSLRWAQRSKSAHEGSNSALFGIIQGGMYPDLRELSLNGLSKIDFDGFAIGGLSVGEPKHLMQSTLLHIMPMITSEKPRYLMGVGTPLDLVLGAKLGIDMFDCVMPTRSGRTGLAFTWGGKINLKNSKYEKDKSPLDVNCNLKSLNCYSKAYLNHLIKSNELLASMIISLHNINFYQQFMLEIRNNIKKGTFTEFYTKYIKIFSQ